MIAYSVELIPDKGKNRALTSILEQVSSII